MKVSIGCYNVRTNRNFFSISGNCILSQLTTLTLCSAFFYVGFLLWSVASHDWDRFPRKATTFYMDLELIKLGRRYVNDFSPFVSSGLLRKTINSSSSKVQFTVLLTAVYEY